MEQLFMQIFDRKTWIEDQLRQQRDSYTQSLAFNLVANGDRPPCWLWTTGPDPSHYGYPKDLSIEQMISEILFPTHQAIARSVTLSIMPDFGGHKDSQKNKCIKETCALNNCFGVKDMNQACPNNVEAVSSCDVSGIQYSQLIQMQPEIQPAKRPKIANHVEEEYNLDKFTGRLTRSMLASAKSGCVKDSADSNKKLTCFHGEDSVEDRVPLTEASKLPIGELSESGELLNLVEDGIKEDEETKIAQNGNTVVDKSDNNNVAPQQFGEETDAACGVHRSWKMASSIASMEPKITSFDEAMKSVKAKLACEDSEKFGRSSNGGSKEKFVLLESENLEHNRCPASCNNKSSKLTSMMPSGVKFMSSGKKIVPLRSSPTMHSVLNTDSTSYSEVGVANLQAVKSVKAKLPREDSEKFDRSSNGGSKEKFVLLEPEDLEHGRCPASCNNKSSKLTSMMPSGVKFPPFGKKIVPLRSSHVMDSVLNCSEVFSSHVSDLHEASSLIEPNNILPYKFEETLHGNSVDASSKENQDTYFEKTSSELESVQSLELGRPALLEREDLEFVTRATLGIVKPSPALASSSLSESVPSYTLPVSCVLNPVMYISDQVSVLPSDSKRELSEKLVVQDVDGSFGKIIEVITSSPLRPIPNAQSDYSILRSSLKVDVVSDSKKIDAIRQKTPNFTDSLKPLLEPTYFLRSSVGIDGNFSSLKRTGSLLHSSGDNDMRSEAQTDNTHAVLEDFSQIKDLTPEMLIQTSRENHNEQSKPRYFLRSYTRNVTWPKRRKLESEPDHFLATYTRLRPKSLVNMQEGNDYIRKRSFENTSGDMPKFDMETKTLDASLDKNLEELHQSKKRHKKMADPCSKGKNQISNSSEELFLEDGNVNCCSKVKARIPESTALDSEDGQNILCEHEGAKISGCLEQFIMETSTFPGERSLCTNESARLSHHDDNNLASCDETMPEFERFSIDIPSFIEDQIIFNESNNMIPDVHWSLPAGAGLWEHIKLSDPIQLDDVEKEQVRACKSGKDLNLHCQLGSAFDGSLSRRPHSYSASSKELSSNPEFTCFRIDENSSTSEENILVDEFDNTSEEGVGLSGIHNSTNRKVLWDISSACQNAATLTSGRLDSVNTGSYFSNQVDVNPSLENKYITDNKENSAPLVCGGIIRNDAESIRSVSNRSETRRRANERNSSSFIPLIQKKQEAVAPLAGKRDIKVKALEIAEATKRLEEKKRNEREQQKAAAKIERSRLEQEKARQVQIVQKQKEVTRHKKEADLAARKREREEQERKERERKRRCTEEARQQQRKQRRDTADDKEQKKKVLAKETKREMNLEKGKEISEAMGSWLGNNTNDTHKGSYDVKKVVCSTNALQKVIKDRMSVTNKSEDVSCSYLISPYQDSDYEDGMEDIRRKKKYIPLWARKESLEQGLLAMRDMDPAEIFSRKNSFNLREVLAPRAHRAPLSLMR